MKLLLDESVPRRLASSFPEAFTLRTVQEMGWAGTGNGLLLSLSYSAATGPSRRYASSNLSPPYAPPAVMTQAR